jgi:hypothetical protein
MLVEIYDALKEAGASEEKARAAATSLTGRDDRLDQLDRHMREEFAALGARVSALEHRADDLAQDVAGLKSVVATLKTDVRRHPAGARPDEMDARDHHRRHHRPDHPGILWMMGD